MVKVSALKKLPAVNLISAEKSKQLLERAAIAATSGMLNALLGLVSLCVRADKSFAPRAKSADWSFVDEDALQGEAASCSEKTAFAAVTPSGSPALSGTGEFLKGPVDGASWRLGFSSVSLVPAEVCCGNYYLGGFLMAENGFSNRVERVIDDMRARVIALDDSSGRGISVFAVVDCIGLNNGSIRQIRALALQKISRRHADAKIASISVCSTHAHSCLDTQGLWSNVLPKMLKNGVRGLLGKKMESGANEEYLELLCNRVAEAMCEAYDAIKKGKLTYAEKELDGRYFSNKNRPSASAVDTTLRRLVFTPEDGSRPTMLVNFGAHPDIAGLPTSDGQSNGRALSADYVGFMSATAERSGYNFIFFNGAICGIYAGRSLTNDGQPMTERWQQSERYGAEMAKIALSLTKTQQEIESDPLLFDKKLIDEETKNAGGADNYTLWCNKWQRVEQTEVEPYFNLKLQRVCLPVTSPVIRVAGKLRLVNSGVLRRDGRLCVMTEIGIIEFGSSLRVAMVPGEFCVDLAFGGTSLTEERSFSRRAFKLPVLSDLFGKVAVFGLANDAIGYIVPDNDYAMAGICGHYQETVSLGKKTASALMSAFGNLSKE